MDIREKVIKTLARAIPIDYVRLEDDDGISGFVVSPKFVDMSSWDRQELIDATLRGNPDSLPEKERRRVVMIAGITPAEYDVVGTKVRVHEVRELADGTVEVLIQGNSTDAQYVRGTLMNKKGVQATEPRPVPDSIGTTMLFQASGSASDPLTKAKASRILKKDRYIQMAKNP